MDKPVPTLGPGEVLVRIAAAPVDPSDLTFTRGRYGFTRPLPTIPGFEASGRVVAGSGGYARALLGRRVACGVQGGGDGTWAEYVRVDARACLPLLLGVTLEQGAALLVNLFTALALVERAQKRSHNALVQTAAGSALGRMIARLATRRRIAVVNVVRRSAQADELRAAGAEHMLCSGDADFDDRFEGLCKDLEATLAFDAVGGALTGRLLAAVPRGSTAVVYGALAKEAVRVPPEALIFGHKRVEGFWPSDYLGSLSLPRLVRRAVGVQRAFRVQKLKARLEEVVRPL